MPFFKYIGKEQSMNGVYGHDFSDHRSVEVTDPLAIRKLSGNSYFELVVGAGYSKPETVHEAEPGPEVERCDDDFGIFRMKADGEKYSKPDKVCSNSGEVDAYLAENGIAKEDRLILRRSKTDAETEEAE